MAKVLVTFTYLLNSHFLENRLNQESEGMHVIEHILLRPAEPWAVGEEDFYSNRISVVLPNRTARGGNRQFQLLVEETVWLNCPAHIMPTFYWLDAVRMAEFEGLCKSDLANRYRPECVNNHTGRALIDFLRRHAPQLSEPLNSF
jgi:hypothetical protein